MYLDASETTSASLSIVSTSFIYNSAKYGNNAYFVVSSETNSISKSKLKIDERFFEENAFYEEMLGESSKKHDLISYWKS